MRTRVYAIFNSPRWISVVSRECSPVRMILRITRINNTEWFQSFFQQIGREWFDLIFFSSRSTEMHQASPTSSFSLETFSFSFAVAVGLPLIKPGKCCGKFCGAAQTPCQLTCMIISAIVYRSDRFGSVSYWRFDESRPLDSS